MGRYLARRLLQFFPVLLATSTLIFVLLRVLPGDPALLYLQAGRGSEAVIDEQELITLRHNLGIDRPIYVQYVDWWSHAVRGDLGVSIRTGKPVVDTIKTKFPVTLELAVFALTIGFSVAVTLGTLMALRQDTMSDYIMRVLSILGLALPSFWVGMLLIVFLSRVFHWLPPLGYKSLFSDPGANLKQIVFALIPLTIGEIAVVSRLARSTMLEVLRQDYIRTARAKGLRNFLVISRHALKNAMIPVFTQFGLRVAAIAGGTVIVESLFNIPGLGRELLSGINNHDLLAVQGIVVFITIWVLSVNLLVDMVYGFLDPRIRYT